MQTEETSNLSGTQTPPTQKTCKLDQINQLQANTTVTYLTKDLPEGEPFFIVVVVVFFSLPERRGKRTHTQ
jgi:hypothetical protein